MKVRALFVGAVMLVALPLGAGERLAIRVTPAVCFSPANLIVRTTVEADSANRGLEISAESADFYRSSAIQLDGEHAPRTTQFEFRSLPPGDYYVSVQLLGSDGRPRAHVTRAVEVIPSGANR